MSHTPAINSVVSSRLSDDGFPSSGELPVMPERATLVVDEAHSREAVAQRKAFDALPSEQQGQLIEFLKSLQVLPLGSRSVVVDEHGNPKRWPPTSAESQR
jgi:hypothetical protein